MKRITQLFFLLLIACNSFAEAPFRFNYQAVYRNGTSPVPNQNITVRFTIHDQTTGGAVVYQEIHSTTTNQFGLFNLTVGGGNVQAGDITAVNWESGSKYLEVELSTNGGGSYSSIGTTQLLSVPYALQSNKADTARVATYGVPAGTIMAFAGNNIPQGWLLCDGSVVGVSTYPNLYNAIGTGWGAGTGTGTFHLPDLRGMFLRGWDGIAGNDPDKANRTAQHTGGQSGNNVGSVQMDEFKSHQHELGVESKIGSSSATNCFQVNGSNVTTSNGSSFKGGNETRPKNAYVKYLIKY
jgi:microcystin-dependent protein